VIFRPSPNFNARPCGVEFLVLHYTGMKTAQAAIELLCDPGAEVSAHYVVDEDGSVTQLVAEENRAWHAGVSYWRGRRGLNDASIGVEIVNPGHEWGYRAFPAAQMDAVTALCRGIVGRHPIPARNVVAHSDIAPNRKQDPGELFGWRGLAAAGVGVWTEEVAAPGDWRADLAAIGYDMGLPEDDVVRAFQRHFLPESLGQGMDARMAGRAAAVRALVDRG
jgi:N-acetylmuramoyl-L-alanine amidase